MGKKCMKKKFRRLSLRVQLIVGICFIVFPLNIMLFFYSNITVKNAEDRLKMTYEKEMQNFQTYLKRVSDEIFLDFNNITIKYWGQMTMSTGMEKLQMINMVNEMKVIWQKTDFICGAYLKLPYEDYIYSTYDGKKLKINDVDALTMRINETDLSSYSGGQLTIKCGNQYYQLWNCKSNGYDFGFFGTYEDLLNGVIGNITNEDGEIYITDLHGDILQSNVEGKGNIADASMGKQSFSISMEELDYQIWQLIPDEILSRSIPFMDRGLYLLALFAVIILPILWLMIWTVVIRPLRIMYLAMKEIKNNHMEYRLKFPKAEAAEFEYAEAIFNEMVQQIQDLRIEKYEAEIEKLHMEAVNLKLQVNPHLLLNSLNMICSLAKIKDFATIQKFSMHLASYLRYSLRNHESLVPLERELQFIRDYLDVQKIRYPGAFTSVYNIEEECRNILIPPLMIQNVVENSIKYALQLNSVIEIIIIARREEDHLIISVIDNGNGMEDHILQQLRNGEKITDSNGLHIGIWNLRQRMQLFYGEEAVLNISSAPNEGTQVWVKLPIQQEGTG